ncbi:MAG: hypothetical protein QG675_57 [Patescibacteria group bacterium]|nr:hypothetical protein [Patescibacteria group bacterium]
MNILDKSVNIYKLSVAYQGEKVAARTRERSEAGGKPEGLLSEQCDEDHPEGTGVQGPEGAQEVPAAPGCPRCAGQVPLLAVGGLAALVPHRGPDGLSYIAGDISRHVGSTPTTGTPGLVAQWSEQATHNRSVAGSIPAKPTTTPVT